MAKRSTWGRENYDDTVEGIWSTHENPRSHQHQQWAGTGGVGISSTLAPSMMYPGLQASASDQHAYIRWGEEDIRLIILCKKESQVKSKKTAFSQGKSTKSQQKVNKKSKILTFYWLFVDFLLTFLDWKLFFLTLPDFLFYRESSMSQ